MKIPGAPKTARGFYEARPSEVVNAAGLVLVDVREEHELLAPVGHIHGVRHVPMPSLLGGALDALTVDTPILVVCHSGMRSARCAEHLARRGFVEVYNLTGGMVRWAAEEHPVARTPTYVRSP